MNYKETIAWLYEQFPYYQKDGKTAYKKDIDNVLNFFNQNGEYYSLFDTIHIGGTNGKGSVSHMLSSILQESGYKTGVFTSPHILDFRERIKINGKKISKSFIVDFVQNHNNQFSDMQMSFFEMNVAMAFKYFSEQQVDLSIVEVGIGGRLDATNVINPKLSIITNVSIDHTNLLGNSLSEITKEKAGIIKTQTPVLIGQKNKYIELIEDVALNLQAPIYYAKNYNYSSDLHGDFQKENINTTVTGIEILNHLGYSITETHIINGLSNVVKNTGFSGRWQILSDSPLVICDIAHNVTAIKSICNQLSKIELEKHIIFGVSKDKDVEGIISHLPNDYRYYICGSSNPRIVDPNLLINIFKKYNLSYKMFNFSYTAYQYLMKRVTKKDLIMITGSTFIVSDILKYLD